MINQETDRKGDRLKKILTCVPSVLKWKLLHLNELEIWSKVRHIYIPYLAPLSRLILNSAV